LPVRVFDYVDALAKRDDGSLAKAIAACEAAS